MISQIPVWHDGWTFDKAYSVCQNAIQFSAAGMLCSQLPAVNMDQEILTCVEDIQVCCALSYQQSTWTRRYSPVWGIYRYVVLSVTSSQHGPGDTHLCGGYTGMLCSQSPVVNMDQEILTCVEDIQVWCALSYQQSTWTRRYSPVWRIYRYVVLSVTSSQHGPGDTHLCGGYTGMLCSQLPAVNMDQEILTCVEDIQVCCAPSYQQSTWTRRYSPVWRIYRYVVLSVTSSQHGPGDTHLCGGYTGMLCSQLPAVNMDQEILTCVEDIYRYGVLSVTSSQHGPGDTHLCGGYTGVLCSQLPAVNMDQEILTCVEDIQVCCALSYQQSTWTRRYSPVWRIYRYVVLSVTSSQHGPGDTHLCGGYTGMVCSQLPAVNMDQEILTCVEDIQVCCAPSYQQSTWTRRYSPVWRIYRYVVLPVTSSQHGPGDTHLCGGYTGMLCSQLPAVNMDQEILTCVENIQVCCALSYQQSTWTRRYSPVWRIYRYVVLSVTSSQHGPGDTHLCGGYTGMLCSQLPAVNMDQEILTCVEDIQVCCAPSYQQSTWTRRYSPVWRIYRYVVLPVTSSQHGPGDTHLCGGYTGMLCSQLPAVNMDQEILTCVEDIQVCCAPSYQQLTWTRRYSPVWGIYRYVVLSVTSSQHGPGDTHLCGGYTSMHWKSLHLSFSSSVHLSVLTVVPL